MNQEQPCALRALTLCDGQSAPKLGPRAHESVPCYCAQLADALERDAPLAASAVRIERARVVAQADELGRVRERQRRWTASVEW